MPTFKCTYRDNSGKLITDTQTAEDQSVLVKELRGKNFYPINIEDVSQPKIKLRFNFLRSRDRELAVFTRQLANLLESGINFTKALNLLVDHTKDPQMQKDVAKIRNEVENGGHFYEALSKFPKRFPTLYVSMIKAGESGENLEEVLSNLAEYTERTRENRETIISMLIYPAVLLFVGAATIIFMMTFVFPRMIFIFNNTQGKSLPLVTKMLIGMSTFLSNYWGWILLLGVAIGVFVYQLLNDRDLKIKLHQLVFKIPVVGDIIQKVIFVRFTNVLGLVLANGVSIVEALEVASGVIQNMYVNKQMSDVQRRVYQGGTLSQSLSQANVFDPMMINMISVGEEAGTLDESLLKVSKIYDKEAQEQAKRLIHLLEPTFILLLAVGVGFIVMAILLPIFQMNLHIQ